jgi:hypothetical protein
LFIAQPAFGAIDLSQKKDERDTRRFSRPVLPTRSGRFQLNVSFDPNHLIDLLFEPLIVPCR